MMHKNPSASALIDYFLRNTARDIRAGVLKNGLRHFRCIAAIYRYALADRPDSTLSPATGASSGSIPQSYWT